MSQDIADRANPQGFALFVLLRVRVIGQKVCLVLGVS